jgi:phage terminase large subunit GpA-like protein
MTQTLATLQTERERLRAERARTDYESDLAQTCTKQDLTSAGRAIRARMLALVDRIGARMLEAIEGEQDETRVHYLMSDTALDLLRQAGQEAEEVSTALPAVGERVKRGATPRELLTVSQWADRYRWLLSGTNLPGRWSTQTVPYMREIMDALSEHSDTRQVTFMKSAGVAGTEGIFNWIGYIMHHLQNKDLLLVVPTLELRDRSFNPRITKMLEESPVLAELVTTAARNKANRADLIEYGACARIIKAGANSPDSLRADHLPYVICDEVDAFPWDVGGEGDPMTLIENRQRTFSRAKTLLVSTPTIEGRSRIDQQYQRSDRRRYHVPCPHCGEYQTLEFGGKETDFGLKWRVALPDAETGEVSGRTDQVTDAWYCCRHCHGRIDEGHKTDMLAHGRWISGQPAVKLHRGYHINALYAPAGLGLTWAKIAQKWLDCQGDSAELKAFVNTFLGEVWREEGDSIESLSLITRLEEYPETLPIILTTAGTDVQKDRLEITLVKWGAAEEGWIWSHHILPGDTAQPDVWDDLDDLFKAEGIEFACIDSGYNTSMVYAFCESRRWCIPTKGMPGPGRPLIEDERKRRQRLRRRKRSISPEPIGVDQGKALLYARFKMTAPGPGYIHFRQSPDFDDEYFAQLAAEKLVTKFRGSRPFQEWVQIRPRNEALDCMVLNLAALRLSGRKNDEPKDETGPPEPPKKRFIPE